VARHVLLHLASPEPFSTPEQPLGGFADTAQSSEVVAPPGAQENGSRFETDNAYPSTRGARNAPPQGVKTMAESITMTRGQLHDLLARFAVENPKYREALINDPKMVVEKQLGHNLGKLTVKSVIETPDTMYVVVPYVTKEGELSDSDLENVAGGFLDNLAAKCEISGGLNLLSSNVAIELG
jgi:hypothetical protein